MSTPRKLKQRSPITAYAVLGYIRFIENHVLRHLAPQPIAHMVMPYYANDDEEFEHASQSNVISKDGKTASLWGLQGASNLMVFCSSLIPFRVYQVVSWRFACNTIGFVNSCGWGTRAWFNVQFGFLVKDSCTGSSAFVEGDAKGDTFYQVLFQKGDEIQVELNTQDRTCVYWVVDKKDRCDWKKINFSGSQDDWECRLDLRLKYEASLTLKHFERKVTCQSAWDARVSYIKETKHQKMQDMNYFDKTCALPPTAARDGRIGNERKKEFFWMEKQMTIN